MQSWQWWHGVISTRRALQEWPQPLCPVLRGPPKHGAQGGHPGSPPPGTALCVSRLISFFCSVLPILFSVCDTTWFRSLHLVCLTGLWNFCNVKSTDITTVVGLPPVYFIIFTISIGSLYSKSGLKILLPKTNRTVIPNNTFSCLLDKNKRKARGQVRNKSDNKT